MTSGPAYAKIKYVLTRERQYADVAELADALDSGSSEGNFIWVQVPSSAPEKIPVESMFRGGFLFAITHFITHSCCGLLEDV